MSTDPVGGTPEYPQSWNRYSYVRNNPLALVDPTGKDAEVNCVDNDCVVSVEVQVLVDPSNPATIIAGGQFGAAAETYFNGLSLTASTGENLTFDVNYSLVDPSNLDPAAANTMVVMDRQGRAVVQMIPGTDVSSQDVGLIFTRDSTGNPSGYAGIAPHETGHFMGIRELGGPGDMPTFDPSPAADIMREGQPTNGAPSLTWVLSHSNLNSTVRRQP